MLLESARQKQQPIYVVLTMRSDYLGDCDALLGLPEAISDSQYLTPRMTRDQLEQAITGPLRQFDAEAAPNLVNQVLNEVGTDPDQLPLMQHALMRTWRIAGQRAVEQTAPGIALELSDYQRAGGFENALSEHADAVWKYGLKGGVRGIDRRRVAEKLFQCLSDRRDDGRVVRRPVKVQDAAAETGFEISEIMAVADAFRAADCNFLLPAAPEPLRLDTVLDISHESMLRQWQRLRNLVLAEAESASMYRRLHDAAQRYEQEKGSLLGWRDVAVAQEWRDSEQPTAAWAERYGGQFAPTLAFLDKSRRNVDWQRAAIVGVCLLSLIAGLLFYRRESMRAAEFSRLASAAKFAERSANRELANANWQRAVDARDRVHDGIRAAHYFLQSAEASRSAQDPKLAANAAFAAHHATPLLRSMPHDGPVHGALFSGDESRVLTWSRDGTARLWDVARGDGQDVPPR
jgi:hypothetical protein